LKDASQNTLLFKISISKFGESISEQFCFELSMIESTTDRDTDGYRDR
jgi:hypothetical protein